MLNPKLKLNQNLFTETVEKKSVREGFGEALVELGEIDPSVVALTADLSESVRTDGFAKKFPERFFEVGVAEQNMAAIAAGLGVSGKIAFIASYATFSPGKNLETIRTTIAYNQANVKIAGHHIGLQNSNDGATHQATEDIAIMRTLPEMTVFSPCDAIEAKKITKKAAKIYGPVYLRFTRDKTPVITTEKTPFDIKKVQVFWISKKPRVTIFATGYLLYQALLAAKILEEQVINVLVANVATIKPADEKTIIELAKQSGRVITVEDHQVVGGMGSMIAEVLAKHFPTQIKFLGLQNKFGESGQPLELIKKYGIDEKAIIKAVKANYWKT